MNKLVYRVIDANFNRVREGLRVCEEFMRFFSNDKALTKGLKEMRNRISGLYNRFSDGKKSLFSARDVKGDVAKEGFSFERKRAGTADVFWANMQRTKEALRVLEEFSKLDNTKLSDEFRKLRFKAYDLEKRAYKKLERQA